MTRVLFLKNLKKPSKTLSDLVYSKHDVLDALVSFERVVSFFEKDEFSNLNRRELALLVGKLKYSHRLLSDVLGSLYKEL